MNVNAERFFSKIQKTDNCWLWTGYKDKKGYGGFFTEGKMQRSHRVSYFLENKKWPELHILHSCDNPSCVNPDHLREGTHKENMEDASKRDRLRTKYNTEACSYGHPRNKENSYVNPKTGKIQKCRTCDRVRAKNRYSSKLADSGCV